jgi:hypothetical protein
LIDQAGTNPGNAYVLTGNVTTTLGNPTVADGQGAVNVMVSAIGTWVFQVSDTQKQSWTNALIGKDKSEAQAFLQSRQGIKMVIIQLNGGDGNMLPGDAGKITITVQTQ